MELIIGIMLIFGGVGIAVSKDMERQAKEDAARTIVGKEIRFIQETRETTYKAEPLGGWKRVQ
jgi:hypothetical protein